MDWDDEFDGMTYGTDSAGSTLDEGSGSGLDPMAISDPASAYFLLSDDAQEEITETRKKRMKCRSCGHRFTGEIYDRCPKCDSLNTEEVLSFIEDQDEAGDVPNMKCLSCGHTFVGDIYDRCPECFSSDTEQMAEENADRYW
jgi:predicted Zn-ribbon and HTH transcriptional regulator